jgi:PPP family 3-phenylpropionic acid transporter
MSPDSSTALRLAALYAATFLGLGVQLPFLPVWLAGRGIGADAIAMVLAIPMVVRLVVTPWTAGLADGRVGPVRVLAAAQLIVAAAMLALPAARELAPVAILVAVCAIAQSPTMPLCDVLTIAAVKRHPRLHYGRIRLWGSIAYLAANLGAGVLIGIWGAGSVPFAIAASAVLALAAALFAPKSPREKPAEPGPASRQSRRIPAVLMFVIAGAAMVQASHAMIYAFGSISFEAAGFPPSAVGALWAVGVLAEILLFAAFGGAVGTGFPAFAFLAVGAASAAVRWGLMAAGPSAWLLPVLMAMHGLSFGATHLGTIGAFANYAPELSRARSQGVFVSATALATGLATLASGPLYRAFGAAGFAGMAPLGLAGLACVALAVRFSRGAPQPQSAGDGGRTTLPS